MTVEHNAVAPPLDLDALVRLASTEHPDWSPAFCFGLASPLGFFSFANDRLSPSRWIVGTRPDLPANLATRITSARVENCEALVRSALRENALAMDLDRNQFEAIMGMELLAEEFGGWADLPDAPVCAEVAAAAVQSPPRGAFWRGYYADFLREAASYFPPARELGALLEPVCADWRLLAQTLDRARTWAAAWGDAALLIRRLALREEFFWGRVMDATG